MTREDYERITLRLPPGSKEKLAEMQVRAGADSTQEVVRRALAVYDAVLRQTEAGREIHACTVLRDGRVRPTAHLVLSVLGVQS